MPILATSHHVSHDSLLTGILDVLLLEKQQALSGTFIASLLGDQDPDVVLECAKTRLRRVPLQNITLELLQRETNATTTEVHELSEPCQLHDIDFFITHSWEDDAKEKYEALRNVGEEFCKQKGRWPTVWLDKLCIDQNGIEVDLQCLPIFIMGCDQLLVLLGKTYCKQLLVSFTLMSIDSLLIGGCSVFGNCTSSTQWQKPAK